ncbi:uncharacterized protein LOC111273316, partial [Varroa jacobsoni]|uniref:uncharacterized protein LOC111273316 n=1 Tax=Varroa jacobsoni TaxID=62625 RepID=UPI000BF4F828
MEVKLIQINLNRSSIAHDLLEITTQKYGIHLGLLSEPNYKRVVNDKGIVVVDDKKDAAIYWSGTRDVVIRGKGAGNGFAWVEIEHIAVIYTCYFSPNKPTEEYKKFLEEIGQSLKQHDNRKKIIITGDFNAKNIIWGSGRNDRRGTMTLEWLATEGLAVLNDGKAPTCEHGGHPSYIDITMVNNEAAASTTGWKVLNKEESGSDHHYIFFQIEHTGPAGGAQGRTRRWQARKLDQQILCRELEEKCEQITLSDIGNEGIHIAAQQLSQLMIDACTKADRRRPTDRSHHRPKHWWNREIAELRKICVKKRRTYTRTRSWQKRTNSLQPETEQRAAQQLREYQEARNKLRKSIRRSKEKSWKKLIEEVDRDVFGLPYQIVMNKIKKRSPPIPPDMVRKAVRDLFPMQSRRDDVTIE